MRVHWRVCEHCFYFLPQPWTLLHSVRPDSSVPMSGPRGWGACVFYMADLGILKARKLEALAAREELTVVCKEEEQTLDLVWGKGVWWHAKEKASTEDAACAGFLSWESWLGTFLHVRVTLNAKVRISLQWLVFVFAWIDENSQVH